MDIVLPSHWTSTVLECLEEKIHGCHELERGFHGTIEAYNYICKEEGKKGRFLRHPPTFNVKRIKMKLNL